MEVKLSALASVPMHLSTESKMQTMRESANVQCGNIFHHVLLRIVAFTHWDSVGKKLSWKN